MNRSLSRLLKSHMIMLHQGSITISGSSNSLIKRAKGIMIHFSNMKKCTMESKTFNSSRTSIQVLAIMLQETSIEVEYISCVHV